MSTKYGHLSMLDRLHFTSYLYVLIFVYGFTILFIKNVDLSSYAKGWSGMVHPLRVHLESQVFLLP